MIKELTTERTTTMAENMTSADSEASMYLVQMDMATCKRWHGYTSHSILMTLSDPRIQEFYTNKVIINDFKTYIKKLITHVNRFTGLTYAQDPTVYAFETGNELGGPHFRDMNVPIPWIVEISVCFASNIIVVLIFLQQYLNSLAPRKLVMDGTYGINKTHLSIREIDIFSNHFYPPNNTQLWADIDLVASKGKTYMAGEYDWTGNVESASPLPSFFGIVEERQHLAHPAAIGTQFWSLFGHNVPNCYQFVNHTDGFTLQYGNPSNTPRNNTQISHIRQHLFRMKGVHVGNDLPLVPCPGPLADE